jgi:hypothetical protein
MHYMSHYSASKYAEDRLAEFHRAAARRRLVALATSNDQRAARRNWRLFTPRFSFRPLRVSRQRRRLLLGEANPC